MGWQRSYSNQHSVELQPSDRLPRQWREHRSDDCGALKPLVRVSFCREQFGTLGLADQHRIRDRNIDGVPNYGQRFLIERPRPASGSEQGSKHDSDRHLRSTEFRRTEWQHFRSGTGTQHSAEWNGSLRKWSAHRRSCLDEFWQCRHW
jgi:hypothetical protein